MTAIVASRQTNMPGYNSLDMDAVHTAASDYSLYAQQGSMMVSSGSYAYTQTVPADLHGPAWDATATEGSQNFHGEPEEYPFQFGHVTPRGHGRESAESVDELPSKWIATEDTSVAIAEPMRRISSRSSSGSHKHKTVKASSRKSRPRILSVSQDPHVSQFNIAGNASMDPYLLQDSSDAQSVSSQMYYPMPMSVGMSADGMAFADGLASSMLPQHMDPTQMQLDFDASITGNSPSGSWGSSLSPIESRLSSPGISEEAWTAAGIAASPAQGHGSPSLSHHHGNGAAPADEYYTDDMLENSFLPPGLSRRSSGDGESSARDHPLYKTATPKEDGLFHCPWEGDSSCNHKPEKLKCNYDKFVDSHLKPYRCKIESCVEARFSSTACLLRHEREAHAMHGHGDKPYLCTYEGCDRSLPGSGFPRNWNLRDHMRRVHNDNGQSLPPSQGSSSGRGSQSQSAKGRKRKSKDSSESSSGRKSSVSKPTVLDEAAIAAAKAVAAEEPLREQWWELRRAAKACFDQYDSPDAFETVDQAAQAAEHLSAMQDISRRLKKSSRRSHTHAG